MLDNRSKRNRVHGWNAPAKLNLGLAIVGQRSDGYHLLESLFWPINFADRLTFQASDKTSLECRWSAQAPIASGPLPESDATNLVMRAMKEAKGERRTWKIRLEKMIPLGAGLGGGSSDAGTVLRFLRKKEQLAPDLDANRITKEIGADVAYFRRPVPSWVTGIGERIRPLEVAAEVKRQICFLLVLLPESSRTSDIFSHFRTTAKSRGSSLAPPCEPVGWNELNNFLRSARNDLEPSASALSPLVKETLQQLRKFPSLYAGLSGTGSTCFAVFDDFGVCEKTLQGLSQFIRENNCRSVTATSFVMHN